MQRQLLWTPPLKRLRAEMGKGAAYSWTGVDQVISTGCVTAVLQELQRVCASCCNIATLPAKQRGIWQALDKALHSDMD